jgi:hypothetical protein
MENDFDPERFRNPELEVKAAAMLDEIRKRATTAKTKSPTSAKSPGITFVMFPKIWWEGLARLDAGASAYRIALCLLYEAIRSKPFRSGPAVITLSNAMARRWGVGRKGKDAALQSLREAALVSVEERLRKSPLVTVRFAD